ncbi:MAG: hypothetical protein GY865_03275 [candidate division Zixibacteria bacterium]|nr:hypothetical protein [candidate division Zixibacteria bacterium]
MWVWDLFKDWFGFMADVYSNDPLSGAIITLAAYPVYKILEKKEIYTPKIRAILIFIGWTVATTILGVFIKAIGGLWDYIAFVYDKFEQEPIFVTIIFLINIIAYFVWGWIWKKRGPNIFWRILILIGAFTLLTSFTPLYSAIMGN